MESARSGMHAVVKVLKSKAGMGLRRNKKKAARVWSSAAAVDRAPVAEEDDPLLPWSAPQEAWEDAYERCFPQVRVLFCMEPENRLRRFCMKMLVWRGFYLTFLLLTLSNFVTIAARDPVCDAQLGANCYRGTVLDGFELAFTILFSIEVAVQAIAKGVIMHRGSFLRSGWGVLDVAVVTLGWLSLAPEVGSFGSIRTLRLFRAFRGLRRYLPAIRVLSRAIVAVAPTLGHLFVQLSFFFLVYAIAGLQLFEGTMTSRCVDSLTGALVPTEEWPGEDIYPQHLCSTDDDVGRACDPGLRCADGFPLPVQGTVGFDNLGVAAITVFQSITLSQWTQYMYWTGHTTNQIIAYIYFISMVLLGAFLILNMAIAAITTKYDEIDQVEAKAARGNIGAKLLLLVRQGFWKRYRPLRVARKATVELGQAIGKRVAGSRIGRATTLAYNRWRNSDARQRLRRFLAARRGVVYAVLLANYFSLAAYDVNQPPAVARAQHALYIFFTAILGLSAAADLAVRGGEYFTSPWSLLDAAATVWSVAEVAAGVEQPYGNAVRIVLLLKPLARLDHTLGVLVDNAWRAVKGLVGFLPFYFVAILVLALVGMQLFGGNCVYTATCPGQVAAGEVARRAHFDDLYTAYLTVFRVMTADSWNDVMADSVRAVGAWAVLYFVAVFFVGLYVLLNVWQTIVIINICDNLKEATISPKTGPALRLDPTGALAGSDDEDEGDGLSDAGVWSDGGGSVAGGSVAGGSVANLSVASGGGRKGTAPLVRPKGGGGGSRRSSAAAMQPPASVTIQDVPSAFPDGTEGLPPPPPAPDGGAVDSFAPPLGTGPLFLVPIGGEDSGAKGGDVTVDEVTRIPSRLAMSEGEGSEASGTPSRNASFGPRSLSVLLPGPGDASPGGASPSVRLSGVRSALRSAGRSLRDGEAPRSTRSNRAAFAEDVAGGGDEDLVEIEGEGEAAARSEGGPDGATVGSPVAAAGGSVDSGSESFHAASGAPPRKGSQGSSWRGRKKRPRRPSRLRLLMQRRRSSQFLLDKWDNMRDRLATWLTPFTAPDSASLFCLPPQNPVRRLARRIVESDWCFWVIMAAVVANALVMGVEAAMPDEKLRALAVLNAAFTFVFALELALKVVAWGAVLGEGSYLRSPAAWLDCLVVATSLASVRAELLDLPTDKTIRAIRVARSLMLLRLFTKLRTTRALWATLREGGGVLLRVLLINWLIWSVFAVAAVRLFGGAMHRCTDESVFFRSKCTEKFLLGRARVETTAKWKPVFYWQSLDHYFYAMLHLYEVASLEQWSEYREHGEDATGWATALRARARPSAALFFHVFLYLGVFFGFAMIIGTVVHFFSHARKADEEEAHEAEGRALLTAPQKELRDILALAIGQPLRKKQNPPRTRFRRALYDAVHRWWFELAVQGLVLGNTVLLAALYSPRPDRVNAIFETANEAFTIAFGVEMALKLIALGPRVYLASAWERFDGAITVLGLLGLLATVVRLSFVGPNALRVLRLARILRFLRLARYVKGVRVLMTTLTHCLPALGSVGLLLALLIYVYGIVGVWLFRNVMIDGATQLSDDVNFRTLPRALVTLYRMTTGENWNWIMWDHMRDPDTGCTPGAALQDCGTTWAAPIFFCSFMFLTYFIGNQLFVAVVLDAFENVSAREEYHVSERDVEGYAWTWERQDPSGSGYVHVTSGLRPVLRTVGLLPDTGHDHAVRRTALTSRGPRPPKDGSSVMFAALRILDDVPVAGGRVHYYDLIKLIIQRTYREHGVVLPPHTERQLERLAAARFPDLPEHRKKAAAQLAALGEVCNGGGLVIAYAAGKLRAVIAGHAERLRLLRDAQRGKAASNLAAFKALRKYIPGLGTPADSPRGPGEAARDRELARRTSSSAPPAPPPPPPLAAFPALVPASDSSGPSSARQGPAVGVRWSESGSQVPPVAMRPVLVAPDFEDLEVTALEEVPPTSGPSESASPKTDGEREGENMYPRTQRREERLAYPVRLSFAEAAVPPLPAAGLPGSTADPGLPDVQMTFI